MSTRTENIYLRRCASCGAMGEERDFDLHSLVLTVWKATGTSVKVPLPVCTGPTAAACYYGANLIADRIGFREPDAETERRMKNNKAFDEFKRSGKLKESADEFIAAREAKERAEGRAAVPNVLLPVEDGEEIPTKH